jgi:hypothetical protein
MKKNNLLLIFIFSLCTHSFLFAQENVYKSGKKDGVWNYYGSNKVLLARHFYKEGVRTGIWEFYTIDGKLWWTYNFDNSTANYLIANPADGFYSYLGDDGKWVKKDPDAKTIWLSSESQWNNFLVNNLKMHEESVPARVPGKVEVRVTVDENGNATGYKLGNNVEADLDKEALRVAKLYGPEFVPAQKNGKNVKSVYTLKVSYKLADSR